MARNLGCRGRARDKALYAAKRSGRNCVHVAPAVFS